ncbi:caspase family protein [Yoonia sp. F2084L]|uniref:caspase family protein n=1 Tax=Yoonia sp. F2084L TaxID=2926419 RepID=UPI001FF26888|nr:caspase family protein [Yoonia sp. F2084L]MCK0094126.1 caspase family protein [Yoonia sp. F2084L]
MRQLVLCFFLFFAQFSHASERVALVIGMAEYETVVTLDNTINDAIGVSETLAEIGFEVTTLLDASGEEFRAGVDEFSFRAETADLALIYFAGHGVEVQGENFLIPIDANVTSNRDVQRQALSLDYLLEAVDGARKMRIVILDSCRDDPFGDALDLVANADTGTSLEPTRSAVRGGLAPPAPDRGTLVAFAARDGEVALDGAGNNSPFATALMNNLTQPQLEISLMFRQVRDQVLSATQNQQEPHTYGSLPGKPFYIAGPGDDDSLVTNADMRIAWADIRPDQETKLAALADEGDTRSMVGLAYMRLNAQDDRYNPQEAAMLLSQAADANSAEAQFELAQLYEIGLGVEQDIEKAVALYHASAAADFPDAINDLGFLYFQGGLGIPRDPDRALGFFERAADLRHPQAMFNYAALIDDGLVPDKGSQAAAGYLYQALRSGSAQVFELLRDQPTMFKADTRKALQSVLADNAFYSGTIDGDFGPGTQRGIRVAYGLTE